MPISVTQKRYLHQLARKLRINEPDYRTMVRTASRGRTETCVDLTQAEFDQVLSYMGRRPNPTARLDWRIQTLTAEIAEIAEKKESCRSELEKKTPSSPSVSASSAISAVNPLPGICRQMTRGQTDDWTALDPFQKRSLIEALKAILRRSMDPNSVPCLRGESHG